MPQLPIPIVNNIIFALECEWKPALIAKVHKVSLKTVYRIRENLDIWGTPYPPRIQSIGRPRLLTEAQELVGGEYHRLKS